MYTDKGTQALESAQKFACKVCLKRWDMDYESVGTHFFITTSQVFKTNYIQCTISLTALYIFLLATLYKIISRIPVVIFLIILDHLLVLIICIRHLSHLLFFGGITYQTVLKLLTYISVFKAHIPH